MELAFLSFKRLFILKIFFYYFLVSFLCKFKNVDLLNVSIIRLIRDRIIGKGLALIRKNSTIIKKLIIINPQTQTQAQILSLQSYIT